MKGNAGGFRLRLSTSAKIIREISRFLLHNVARVQHDPATNTVRDKR
jgi:hypothetical protein